MHMAQRQFFSKGDGVNNASEKMQKETAWAKRNPRNDPRSGMCGGDARTTRVKKGPATFGFSMIERKLKRSMKSS